MKHQFKSFDKVLARTSDNAPWFATLYSHYSHNALRHVCCGGGYFPQCIPYNEETAHLIGTSEPYKEPEPKVWRVTDIKANKVHEMTETQFKHLMHDILGSRNDCCYQICRIND